MTQSGLFRSLRGPAIATFKRQTDGWVEINRPKKI